MLNWTKDKPTKEGFYWCRYYPRSYRPKWWTVIVEVKVVVDRLQVYFPGSEVEEDLSNDAYFGLSFWFGPLEAPEFQEKDEEDRNVKG